MNSSVQLNQNSACVDVLSWSQDNMLAAAAGKTVYVLPQKFSSAFKNNFLSLSKEVLGTGKHEQKEYHIKVDIKRLENLNRESYVKQRLDLHGILPGTKGEATKPKVYQAAKFSPICDDGKRSLLACLSTDFELSIYKCHSGQAEQFRELADLSDILYTYMEERGFTLSREGGAVQTGEVSVSKDFDELKKRQDMLSTISIAWSALPVVYTSERKDKDSDVQAPKRLRLDQSAPGEGSSLVLLAAALKSGHIVLWGLQCPVHDRSTASVAAVIEAKDVNSSIAWHCPSDQAGHRAFLAAGGCEGSLTVWSVAVSEEGAVVTEKMLDIMTEDHIPVQAVIWVPSLCTDNTFVIGAAKGPCIMAFQLRMKEGTLELIHQSHALSLNSSLISGIASSRGCVFTSSTDGSIQKTCIQMEQGLSMELSLVEPSSHLITRIDGLALSTNGVCLARFKRRFNIHRFTANSHLHFTHIASGQEIQQVLLDSTTRLCHKFDCLDWLFQTLPAEGSLPSLAEAILSQDALMGETNAEQQALLKLRRLVHIMLVLKLQMAADQSHGKHREQLRIKVKQQEDLTQDVSRQIVTHHVEDALQRLQSSDGSIMEAGTGRAGISSKLMTDWFRRGHTASDQPITDDSPSADTILENCRLCGEGIPLTSWDKDSCLNGHSWERCRLSLLLCQVLRPRQCAFCEAGYAALQATDSGWLGEILSGDCLWCEGPLINR